MENTKEYIAFISYQRKDEEWAEWLQHQLEHYRLPSNILEGHPELPHEIRPLFRDATELSGGILSKEIKLALENSHYLIVICSPNSSKSVWVNKEVQTFIDMGKLEYIIPFIVDGIPYAQSEAECFVPALASLRGQEQELLGISISEMGREVASIKVVARMLNLRFDMLWQRYEREKEEERKKLIETNNKIRRNQARFISEKVLDLVEEKNSYTGCLLALEVLPTASNSDYPYTPEAERAFRIAIQKNSALLHGHSICVNTAVFNKNRRWILSAAVDKTIRLWDVYSGTCFRVFSGHSDDVTSAVFFDNEKKIISVSKDCTIRVWDIQLGVCEKVIEGHQEMITSVSLNSDESCFVTTSNKIIKLWDAFSGECLNTLFGHEDWVNDAKFSLDNQLIVSASSDNTIRIWAVSGECVKVFKGPEEVDWALKAHFNHEGTTIESLFSDALGYEYAIDWNFITGDIIDKKFIDSSDETQEKMSDVVPKGCDVHFWKEDSELCQGILQGHANIVNSVSFSSDGKYVVSTSDDKTVKIWDLENYKCIVTLEGHTSYTKTAVFSPDGSLVLSTSSDKTAKLWDVKTGECLNTWGALKGNWAYSAAFSPNGEFFAIATYEGIELYYTRSRALIKKIYTSSSYVTFSHDGKQLASACNNYGIRLFNIESGRCVQTFAHNVRTSLVAFCTNSNCLVSITDHKLCLWDLNDNSCSRTYDISVEHISLNPKDKRCVYTSSRLFGNNSLHVLDLISGRKIQTFDGHTSIVSSVAFNPQGDRIASGSWDYSIRIWESPALSVLVEKAKERFKDRPLTPEECRLYYLE